MCKSQKSRESFHRWNEESLLYWRHFLCETLELLQMSISTDLFANRFSYTKWQLAVEEFFFCFDFCYCFILPSLIYLFIHLFFITRPSFGENCFVFASFKKFFLAFTLSFHPLFYDAILGILRLFGQVLFNQFFISIFFLMYFISFFSFLSFSFFSFRFFPLLSFSFFLKSCFFFFMVFLFVLVIPLLSFFL